jgi:hypothetical protein
VCVGRGGGRATIFINFVYRYIPEDGRYHIRYILLCFWLKYQFNSQLDGLLGFYLKNHVVQSKSGWWW